MQSYSRLKLRFIDAETSPILFVAFTLYNPASASTTSSRSNTTVNLLSPIDWILYVVRESCLSNSSLRYHSISGIGDDSIWHSNINLFPSSSCLNWGFCVKLGAKCSLTPIFAFFLGIFSVSKCLCHWKDSLYILIIWTNHHDIWNHRNEERMVHL